MKAATKSIVAPPRIVVDVSGIAREYKPVGMCGTCIRPLEALQPGGLEPRHIDDRSPICSNRKSQRSDS